MDDKYKPEVYAKFKYERRLLDRKTKAFVMGLKEKYPETFDELAALAYEFGGVAMVYGVRVAWDLSIESRRNMLINAGYKTLQSEESS